jgi:cell division protein FtsW
MARDAVQKQNSGAAAEYPYAFLVTLGIIQVFGLLMLFSASYTTGYIYYDDSYEFIRDQLIYTVFGELAMWIASRFDYHKLRRWTGWIYAVCLVLLCVVLTCDPINQCRRWLHWQGVPLPSIQVSEIVKFEMVLMTAHIMCRYRSRRKTLRYGFIYPLLPLVPVLALMYFEPHLSGMILMCLIVGSIMLLGGSGGVFILCGLGLGAGGVWFLYNFAASKISYVMGRLEGWSQDLNVMKWQTKQSLFAIGSGGWLGLGLGNSMEKQLWLPECTNDFIFSVVCEELGFVGAVVVIGLFVALILQGIYIAYHAADLYGTLLALGITAQITWQVFLNVAVVTNSMPNTGISLPFFSSGGTSLMMLLGEIGVLLNVARQGAKAQAERAAAAAAAAAAAGAAPAEPAPGRRPVTVP